MGVQYTFFNEEGEKSVASSWEDVFKWLSLLVAVTPCTKIATVQTKSCTLAGAQIQNQR